MCAEMFSDREGYLSLGSWGGVPFSLLFSACVVTAAAAKLTVQQLQYLSRYFRTHDGAGASLTVTVVFKFYKLER